MVTPRDGGPFATVSRGVLIVGAESRLQPGYRADTLEHDEDGHLSFASLPSCTGTARQATEVRPGCAWTDAEPADGM